MTVSAVNHHHNPPAAGKRSRKVAKVITVGFQQPVNTSATTSSSSGNKKEKGKGSAAADGGQPLERRRTKSEHDAAPSAPVISTAGSNSGNSSSAGSGGRADGISRLRLSSSYKEGWRNTTMYPLSFLVINFPRLMALIFSSIFNRRHLPPFLFRSDPQILPPKKCLMVSLNLCLAPFISVYFPRVNSFLPVILLIQFYAFSTCP